jgi:hypothetical protein
MKRAVVIVLTLGCAGLLSPGIASAQAQNKTEMREQMKAARQVLAKYDTNHNRKLDSDEVAALKKDFAEGNATMAAAFDANKDGKLDESEIAKLTDDISKLGKRAHKKKADAGGGAQN